MRESKETKFIYDLDAMLDFIFAEEDRNVDTSIEETFGVDEESDNNVLITKRTIENKTSDHAQHEAIRFEVVKRLWDTMVELEVEQISKEPQLTTMNDVVAYNTCLQYGFIKEI